MDNAEYSRAYRIVKELESRNFYVSYNTAKAFDMLKEIAGININRTIIDVVEAGPAPWYIKLFAKFIKVPAKVTFKRGSKTYLIETKELWDYEL